MQHGLPRLNMATATGERAPQPSPTALVCAGGGITGIAWEVGCLAALEQFLGRKASDFDTYVGISAGAVVTALAANGIPPTDVWAEFANGSGRLFGVETGDLFKLGGNGLARTLRILPRIATGLMRIPVSGLSPAEVVMGALGALPSGIVDNTGVQRAIGKVLAERGTDSFAELKKRLFILAVELDTGRVAAFGERAWRNVPISTAVQASTAVPGLCRPVRIDGRDYVDGAVLKTAHVRRAIRDGARLVLCVNPAGPPRTARIGSERTLLDVMQQSVSMMLRSRMQYAMRCYRSEFPEVDVILVEPTADDPGISNCMSWSDAAAIAATGYRSVVRSFRAQQRAYERILARHGITLRDPDEVLAAIPYQDAKSCPEATGRLGRSLRLLEGRLTRAS
jgi:NTE family protein